MTVSRTKGPYCLPQNCMSIALYLLWYRVLLNALFWQHCHFCHENLSTVIQSWIVSWSCLDMLHGGNFEPFYGCWLFSPCCLADFGSGFISVPAPVWERSDSRGALELQEDRISLFPIPWERNKWSSFNCISQITQPYYWNKTVTERHKMLE